MSEWKITSGRLRYRQRGDIFMVIATEALDIYDDIDGLIRKLQDVGSRLGRNAMVSHDPDGYVAVEGERVATADETRRIRRDIEVKAKSATDAKARRKEKELREATRLAKKYPDLFKQAVV